MRHEKDGQILRRTAKQSWIARLSKKLIEKTTGYKKKREKYFYVRNKEGGNRRGKMVMEEQRKQMEHKTLIFVEQTPKGELGRRLRDVLTRISHWCTRTPVHPAALPCGPQHTFLVCRRVLKDNTGALGSLQREQERWRRKPHPQTPGTPA